jgi:hypothetical protein
MISLEVRSVSSSDVDPDEWEPTGNRVLVALALEIGVAGTKGADLFYVTVATPEGLSEAEREDEVGALASRATIVVGTFSWKKVHAIIRKIVRQCEAATWDESLGKLQRYFQWEYEDFVPAV